MPSTTPGSYGCRMETSTQAEARPDGAGTLRISVVLAVLAASPYAMFMVGYRIWSYSGDWPGTLISAILVTGWLSPFTGLFGCVAGIAAFRHTTNRRTRVIATLAVIISAVAMCASIFIAVNLAMMGPMPGLDVPP
jgi:hypothetical protein